MILRLLIGGFLIAHGLIHASFGSPAPPPGPVAWPFALSRSWALTPLGLGESPVRAIGALLWIVTAAAFAAAGLGYLGIPVLSEAWRALALLGAAASLLLLGLFWDPMLVLGVGIDLVIGAALLWPRAASALVTGS